MDDDFDNDMGLPDEEIGGSIDDVADVGTGGIEEDVEPGVSEAAGTRSSGGARARQSPATTPRAPKAAASAPAKKAAKGGKKKAAPKAVKKKPARKPAKKKAAKKPAPKASRKSGKKAMKRKK